MGFRFRKRISLGKFLHFKLAVPFGVVAGICLLGFAVGTVGLMSRLGRTPAATAAAIQGPEQTVREAEPVGLPDHNKTPGAWDASVTVEDLRTPGFAKSEHAKATARMRRAVFERYRIPYADRTNWTIDHLCPCELGGLSSLENLWPEPTAGEWSAHKKDVLENRLHALVLGGQLSLAAAQEAISADWIRAYETYVSANE